MHEVRIQYCDVSMRFEIIYVQLLQIKPRGIVGFD